MPAGGVRRAAGLRREELAQLADLSVDYVVRLEQGRATSPSVQVLSALSRALRLSTAEREHLFVLAGQTAPGAGRIPPGTPPGVRRLLDQLDGVALTVCDASWNMIEWNPLGAALIGDLSMLRGRERNVAWREFTGMPSRIRCTPEQTTLFRAVLVTDLRAATARYPADPGLRDLLAALRAASADFVRLWDDGVVGTHESNSKTVHHPEVGSFSVDCDVLTAPGSDVKVVCYSAPVGSDAADRLKLLSVIGTQSMSAS
ncbi:transcriptional regulator [Actinoplanes philippinensis]|uniref:Helix-turn-helix domain-containing protein n=1 Tax=Actinoplanes philippinensis TaxID=35752 RepID=A0A1I2MRM7_9ACTN|nr:transcriptional regulator [Actinoplanes philippinensis]SFF93349.1 Helix-turn-helix domain-containing protein [Actinoplanes philippinensis]